MERPLKYTVICDKTKKVLYQTNLQPLAYDLETWEQTENPSVFIKKITKKAYIDTRYDAKLRLYNYFEYTKKGIQIPKYTPPVDSPVLNF